MEPFKITGTLRSGTRTFGPGDEAAFLATSPGEADLARLAARGAVSGVPPGADDADGDGDALPDGFPGLRALTAADKLTYSDLAGVSRADLVAIPGIREKTADNILNALKNRKT